MLLVGNTLWWAWSLLLTRVCSSWSLGSNPSWCFLYGLPSCALAVLYVSISCSKLFLWLKALRLAVLSFVGLLVLCLFCFCPQHLVFGPSFSSTTRILWMSILSRHFVMTKSIICQCPERGCIQMVLRSSSCLYMVFITISSKSDFEVCNLIYVSYCSTLKIAMRHHLRNPVVTSGYP